MQIVILKFKQGYLLFHVNVISLNTVVTKFSAPLFKLKLPDKCGGVESTMFLFEV